MGSGDRLKVGDLEFEVQLAVEVAAQERPKARSLREAAARAAEAARPPAVLDDELDLASLLSENTSTVAADSQEQTVEVRRPKKPAATSAAAPAAKAAKPAEPGVGRTGAVPPPDASSSRDAAAAMLKNFFKGH